MKENIIHGASIGTSNKNSKGRPTGYKGVSINITSSVNLPIGSHITLPDQKTHFEVHGITVNEDSSLSIEAHEVGYWANKIDRKDDFDVRSLIGQEVHIPDEESIKRVKSESFWC